MTTEDMLIVLFCTIDDLLKAHPLPVRPGPVPACSDSEVLTFAVARELLGVTSERRFRRLLLGDWHHLFPHIPAQSELNRRTRWLFGALEELRQAWCQQILPPQADLLAVDTTPLPVKQRKRVPQGPQAHSVHRDGAWQGPGELHAGFGYCAALDQWFYGFRLGILAPLAPAIPAYWALLPAAVNERDAAQELLTGVQRAVLLGDKGFASQAMRDQLAQDQILLLTPGLPRAKYQPPAWARALLRRQRQRIEDPFNTLKDRFLLEWHRAHTVWGLLTRLCAKLAALTVRAVWQQAGRAID